MNPAAAVPTTDNPLDPRYKRVADLSPEERLWAAAVGLIPRDQAAEGGCHSGQNPWAGRSACPD